MRPSANLTRKKVMTAIKEEEDIISTDSEEDTDSPCPHCNDKGGHDCSACYSNNYDPR